MQVLTLGSALVSDIVCDFHLSAELPYRPIVAVKVKLRTLMPPTLQQDLQNTHTKLTMKLCNTLTSSVCNMPTHAREVKIVHYPHLYRSPNS